MTTAEKKILGVLSRLRQKEAAEEPSFASKGAGELPPFYMLEAALVARVRTWRGVFFATAAILTLVIIGQQRIIFHDLFQKMNEQIVIVPGSPEFFRVRPGQIPDESIFIFTEYVADNLGTFSFRNAKTHFQKITAHMSPVAKGRFEALFEERLKDWTSRKLDQTFAYEPVKRFDLAGDERGPKYVAAVEGVRSQYVEGRAFSETRDVLRLEFRARGNLTPDRPFIFEIESIEWMTPEQFRAFEAGKASSSPPTPKGAE